MLMNATSDFCCYKCGDSIRAGERISRVVPGHQYHPLCSPNAEDVIAARQEITKENEAALKVAATTAKSKNSSQFAALITGTLIAEFLIIGAMASRNSPGYYILLRLIVCPLSVFFAYRLYRSNRPIFSVLIGFIAVIYNPIVQVRLPHNTWQFINIATLTMLAAALYLFRPEKLTRGSQSADSLSPFRPCEHCGQERVTLNAQFYENVSYFYERQQRSVDANLCLPCAAKVYRRFTIRTLFGTWWGLIGFFLGPIILVFNTVWFLCMLIGFLWQMRHPRIVGADTK